MVNCPEGKVCRVSADNCVPGAECRDAPRAYCVNGQSSVMIGHSTLRLGPRDMAIWSFPRWRPVAIFNLIQPEMAPFDLSSPKTPPLNQTWRRSVDVAELCPCEIFPICVNRPWGRLSVGRSVVNIHTSYTDLIYSSFARGVKKN